MLIPNRKQGFYFILTVSIAHTKSLYPKLWALMDLWFTTHIKANILQKQPTNCKCRHRSSAGLAKIVVLIYVVNHKSTSAHTFG